MPEPPSTLRIHPADHTASLSFWFDDRPMSACEGDTIAMALWVAGIRTLRVSRERGEPRGVFCAMGVCQECLVSVEGRRVESCLTIVRDGMSVRSIDAADVPSEPADA